MAKKNDVSTLVTSTGSHLSADMVEAITSEGKAFAGLGWNKSDANASCERIGKLVPALKGTGRKLLIAIRSRFGDSNGALSVGGSYDQSQQAFAEISPEDMGKHFVSAVEATLSGTVLPAALTSERKLGVRRGTL